MLNEKLQKVAKSYDCEKCQFTTDRKNNFKQHLLTPKHNSLTLSNEIVAKVAKSCKNENVENTRACKICKKEYQSRVGLWYHSKKCVSNAITSNQNISTMEIIQQNKKLTELLMELIKDKHSLVANNSENDNANNDNNDDGVK
jgi:hypothetical protein